MMTQIRQTGLIVACLAMLLSVAGLATKGINFGIEFTGGVVTEFTSTKPLEHVDLLATLDDVIDGEFRLNGTQDGLAWTLRQSDDTDIEEQRSALSQVAQEHNWPITLQDSVFMGSQIGDELIEKGGMALLVSALCMMAYVTLRFEWRLATSAIVALLHDVLLVLGVFAWCQVRFDLAVLAGLLAIMGYSLNDSIIVGDRIRELLISERFSQLDAVVNSAILSTFRRTLITSSTTLLTVVAIGVMAGDVLGEFALSLGIGVLVGTFSSIFVAGTLPVVLGLPIDTYRPEPISAEETPYP